MPYEEYPPEHFPCMVPGCHNSVVVTDQRTLHWYHTFSGGERPKGYDICDGCEALIPVLTVECLNRPYVSGDSGCIGNGHINLMEEHGRGTAYWYLMNGRRERPRMYPYCHACKHGIVYRAPCRNVGCRGDGQIRCVGDTKQGLVYLTQLKGESFWPVKNCDDCREFIGSLKDATSQCLCCLKHWVFSAGRQIMLVRNEKRERFKIPELCDGCASLSDEQRKAMKRLAASYRRQREMRRVLKRQLASEEGRKALRHTKTETFLRAAKRFIRAPDPSQVDRVTKIAALERVSRYGGQEAVEALERALRTPGVDVATLTRALSNPALTDQQSHRLAEALGKLSLGDKYPPGLMEKPRGDLPMTRALSGLTSLTPKIAQAAAYEIHAAAAIINNTLFPIKFQNHEIATFHYRFQHNRIDSAAKQKTYEADMVIRQEIGTLYPREYKDTYIDFKHSMTNTPYVTKEGVERVVNGLLRGEIDQAIYVSSAQLTRDSLVLIAKANHKLASMGAEQGEEYAPIRTYIQKW